MKTKEQIARIVDNFWLGLGDISQYDNIEGPFDGGLFSDPDGPPDKLLEAMLNPEYLSFVCKHFLATEILPFQAAILHEMWIRPFPMLIGSRGLSKSFLLSIYSLLRALLTQGCKVVIVGAAFRQSKVLFEYMVDIWNRAELLRDICGTSREQGPRIDVDRCTMTIGKSKIIAIPLGNGDKIRGLRANYIICDEFSCLDKNTIIETDCGLIRIKDCLNKDISLFNKDGILEKPKNLIITPETEVYEVTTTSGYSFRCSSLHQVMTIDGWKIAKDLKSSDWLIHENKYQFPTENRYSINRNLAFSLGLMLSEGSVTTNQVNIQMTDLKCVKKYIEQMLVNYPDLHFTTGKRKAHIDKRGWICKKSYYASFCNKKIRKELEDLGLERKAAIDKNIPFSILQSPRDIVISFLNGLFHGDGSCFLWKNRDKNNRLGVAYYSSSLQLVREVQIVLDKLGYKSSIQKRKSKISKNLQYIVRLNGLYAYEFAKELDIKKWNKILKKCFEKDAVNNDVGVVYDKSRKKWQARITIKGKTKLIGRYDSKEKAAEIVNLNKPVNHLRVKSVKLLPDKERLYDFYMPQTNSFMANGFTQHNSVPRQIYETVVGGFAVVSASPVENVKRAGREMGKKHLKIWDECLKDEVTMGNQAILSGTAFYAFNHFAEYWLNYRNIILSRGEPNKLYEIFKGPPHENFNWKDYSIIRIPYDKLPPGLMEEKHIIRAKANIHTGAFLCEYCAVFATDSNGFFKRTLIEACVTSDANMENMPDGVIKFPAAIRGNKKRKYIYGVDPASESDNFTIVIIELHANHSRIVYTWTTKKAKHREVINKGLTEEKDFYRYCGRKIRDLMKSFPCERIMMDSQGGGYAVYEVLQDDKNLQEGEKPIYEIIVEREEKESDDKPGLHILELVNFADAKWTSAANHGMKKDFEDKALLFPEFDPIIIGEAIMDDKATNRIFDTLEDAYMEIEELKNELTTIVHTQTGAQGRDKWDTPEVKIEGGRKGRQHKDRYSALLMANMGARMLARVPEQVEYNHLGGFANQITKGTDGKKCTGPDWFSGSAYNNM